MMTRKEILSIEEYCAEHKISHKNQTNSQAASTILISYLQPNPPWRAHM